ncbi:MAG: LacI family DNA-binding transcriptional regulator [Anaerolineae bacterium]
MPTIKDVAKEAGVSIATVSYVLNNKDEAVSEETRREVWRAVEKIGYMPNVTARNLRSSQSRLIGYAWHEAPHNGEMNPILDHFTYSLAQAAEDAGYHLLTFTYPPGDPIRVYDELIRTGRVDAFVVASTTEQDPRIHYLLERKFPFVAFGRSNPDWDFVWVDTDGEAGMRQSVNMLCEFGHKRIAMIAWDEASLSGSYRYNGYVGAMHDAGLPIPPNYVWRGEHHHRTGHEALEYWWSLPPDERPTAIIAISDLIAIGVIAEAERQGIVIGRDVSLIGYDNAPLTQYLRPPLTTLEQPLELIGQEVIARLCDVMSGKPLASELRHTLLPPRLIVRGSVGYAP